MDETNDGTTPRLTARQRYTLHALHAGHPREWADVKRLHARGLVRITGEGVRGRGRGVRIVWGALTDAGRGALGITLAQLTV